MKLSQLKTRDSKYTTESGPFSYGQKTPRKNSVKALAAEKRKQQEKGRIPVEPTDQRVGTAKRTANEGIFGDALKTFKSYSKDPLDSKGNREAEGKIKDLQSKFIRWSNQTQHSDDPNNIEMIKKYLKTQLKLNDKQIDDIWVKVGYAPKPKVAPAATPAPSAAPVPSAAPAPAATTAPTPAPAAARKKGDMLRVGATTLQYTGEPGKEWFVASGPLQEPNPAMDKANNIVKVGGKKFIGAADAKRFLQVEAKRLQLNTLNGKRQMLIASGVLKEQLTSKQMFKTNKLLEDMNITWSQVGYCYKKNNSVFIREGTADAVNAIWKEVVRVMYDSGQTGSNPKNNAINTAANFLGALGGRAPENLGGGDTYRPSQGYKELEKAVGPMNDEEREAAEAAIKKIRDAKPEEPAEPPAAPPAAPRRLRPVPTK